MIYAISDLHISTRGDKPMNIFGACWNDYLDKIKQSWLNTVTSDDTVLLCGDFSWAINLCDAVEDMALIADLPGKKVLIRGNHDYWWDSYGKLKAALPNNFFAIQNNALKIENVVICGTRGWDIIKESSPEEDKKIFNRELLRLDMALKAARLLANNNSDIYVMIHYPPFSDGFRPSPFTQMIEEYGVKKVIYGHIHGIQSVHKDFFVLNGVQYYLTSCDMVNNQLIKISD